MEQAYSYCLNKLAAKIQVANVCYDSSFSKLYRTHVRVRYSLVVSIDVFDEAVLLCTGQFSLPLPLSS